MKTFFTILVFIGVGFSFWSAKKSRELLMRKLVALQQSGKEDQFVALAGSFESKMFFNASTRTIMKLNYFLLYRDEKGIKSAAQELIVHGQQGRDFVIEMMRIYTYYLEEGKLEEARDTEAVLSRACRDPKYADTRNEIRVLHRLYIGKDKSLVSEMESELGNTVEPDKQMILLYRLAKLSELLGRTKPANDYLRRLSTISKTHIEKI